MVAVLLCGRRGSSAGGSGSDGARRALARARRLVLSRCRGSWRRRCRGQQRYILHVLIFTALFAALALSYDLVVGHVGSLSLAHPAFFGIGAYTAALLATRGGLAVRGARSPPVSPRRAWSRSSWACRMFRLAEHSFAMGTLGFALVTQVVANNWVDFTRGPLCVTGIPKPQSGRRPDRHAARLLLAGARRAGGPRRTALPGPHDVPAGPRVPRGARQRDAGRRRRPSIRSSTACSPSSSRPRWPAGSARSTSPTSACSVPGELTVSLSVNLLVMSSSAGSAACAACWSAAAPSPRCPRCSAWRRPGAW